MARTVRDSILDTRTARSRLKVSGKPYYRAIDTGLHLGYRKGRTGGKWVVRWYVGDQNYKLETIGAADDVIDGDGAQILSFSQAQAAARQLYVSRKREQAGLSTNTGPYTVKSCLDEYLEWMESNRKSAGDTRYRVNSLIVPELGAIECAKLTTAAIQKWLQKTAKTPPRLRTKKGKSQKFRPAKEDSEAVRRRHATANRTFTVLRAALNRAWKDGKIASDNAWRRVDPFREADAARVRYLTIQEAKRLINASEPDFRLLVQAALVTGARYGELTPLTAADFNLDSGTVHIRTSKSGKGRHVVLADEGIKLFSSLAAGRSSGDRILPKASGRVWDTSHQSRPMAAACVAAKITPAANFHCLRHTYASHAIMNGAPLMVVAKNLGHADTRMVEKHYGHLAPSFVADAIRAAAPSFGFKIERNVASIIGGS
jgi:integrase